MTFVTVSRKLMLIAYSNERNIDFIMSTVGIIVFSTRMNFVLKMRPWYGKSIVLKHDSVKKIYF